MLDLIAGVTLNGQPPRCRGRGWAIRLPDGPRVADDGNSGVDDKEQYCDIVESSGSSGILEKLRQAPSREGEDCDETHPAVSSLSRMRDAHGSDSPGDQQQRSSRYGGVVRPLDTPADPVSRDQQDAHSDGGYAKR